MTLLIQRESLAEGEFESLTMGSMQKNLTNKSHRDTMNHANHVNHVNHNDECSKLLLAINSKIQASHAGFYVFQADRNSQIQKEKRKQKKLETVIKTTVSTATENKQKSFGEQKSLSILIERWQIALQEVVLWKCFAKSVLMEVGE